MISLGSKLGRRGHGAGPGVRGPRWTSTWALTWTGIVGVDVAVDVEPVVDLDPLDEESRGSPARSTCKVDDGVHVYVAVQVNVLRLRLRLRSRIRFEPC